MILTHATPDIAELTSVAEQLSRWQHDPWPGHLHPGDLGWHSGVDPAQMARDLHVWSIDGSPVVIAMLDGPEVLRLAVDPARADDPALAAQLARDLTEPGLGIFPGPEAIVEARGAGALRRALRASGWVEDAPWTPFALNLSRGVDRGRLQRSGLRVRAAGVDAAAAWTSIHWSSFKGTTYDDGSRERFMARWTQIMTGPFADRAHSLIGYDEHDVPVAVTTVWTAGPGRPGLIEPMGVARDHHGHGYGTAITLAGADVLARHGASSAVVATENRRPAALATYLSAGFVAHDAVTDLKRA